jgi:protein-disulfide isomerase-like protein with CxxC motif
MVGGPGADDPRGMAPTLTFVFDPYCARSVAAAPTVLALWARHRGRLRFEAVHTGAVSARLGFGPDSERSARAYCALRAAAPSLAIPIAAGLHATSGERLGRRVLTDIALGVGLDPARVLAELRHPERRERARAELERGRSLQLGPGPALLLEHDHVVSSVPLDEASQVLERSMNLTC